MSHKMTKSQYESILSSYISSAEDNRQTLTALSEELTRRYNGECYGNERPERSKVVSNDVQDVVESDMPSLARNFLGVEKICVFKPLGDSPKDIQEAKDKTEYIDWIVRGQEDSFDINHGFLKDIDTVKFGALKWIVEDIIDVKIVVKEDLTAEEIDQVMSSLEGEDVKNVEMVSRSEPILNGERESFDIEFKVTRQARRPRLFGVPPESLLFTPGASSEDDATLVGDKVSRTRGDLLQEGFSMELISNLPSTSADKGRTLPLIRSDENTPIPDDQFGDWASEIVEIFDVYVKIDKDGDGIAERRHILKSGDVILEDEPFDAVPYAIRSALLTPHSIVGTSRAELAVPTAEIQTALKRGLLDNGYQHNAPQIAINDNVNEDDLLIRRSAGIVRVDGVENPGQSLFPINIPYIGNETLQVIQYMDQTRAQTTGTMLASQGLSSDSFEKETAARFNGVQDASKAKIELVARVIANAYQRVYNGLAWLVTEYQTTETEITVLGKQLTVDPSKWKVDHRAKSSIGLGAGDGKGSSESLGAIINLQNQLKIQGSSLVDEVKVYNTLDSLLKSLDIHDTNMYFNNPERPEQLVVRENEVLRGSVEELQLMVQQLQEQVKNPLAEAETIRAQANLIEAQGKRELDIAKLQEDSRQFDVQTAQKARQFSISTNQKSEEHDDNLAAELTKIEANSGQDVQGSLI